MIATGEDFHNEVWTRNEVVGHQIEIVWRHNEAVWSQNEEWSDAFPLSLKSLEDSLFVERVCRIAGKTTDGSCELKM